MDKHYSLHSFAGMMMTIRTFKLVMVTGLSGVQFGL